MELYQIKEKDLVLYEKVKSRIINSREFRIKYFEKNFYTFCMYYFTTTFTTPSADFQKEFCYELQNGFNSLFQGFRECGKTVYFKYYFIYNILFKKKRFQLFIAFDKSKAQAKLFDIAIQLQTNTKILNDFGQLFFKSNQDIKESQKKTIGEFITDNGIKCKALGIGESIRGEVFGAKDGEFRPDLVGLDDIDTLKSTNTLEQIEKNYTFVKSELFGGLGDTAQIIFLFNTIKFDGIGPRLWKDYQNNNNWKLKKIYYNPDNNVWPERLTPEYIEMKKEILGEKSFNANFLGVAETVGSPVFNNLIVKNLIINNYKEDGKYKELRIYKPPTNQCLYGVDTAGGSIDGDKSSIVVRDSKTMELLACFYGFMQPDLLCDIIDRLQELGYYGIIGIERNNTGIATLKKAETCSWYYQLYAEKTIDKITNKKTKKYGWSTNSKTRPFMISEYEEAIRCGYIKEVDKRGQDEMFTFVYNDNSRPEAQLGSHDDYIISDCICYQMRNETNFIEFS